MVSSAAICLLLSRPRPSEGRSCWHNIYTYIDEHIKPKFEEFGFPLDDNYFYVGKYKKRKHKIERNLLNFSKGGDVVARGFGKSSVVYSTCFSSVGG